MLDSNQKYELILLVTVTHYHCSVQPTTPQNTQHIGFLPNNPTFTQRHLRYKILSTLQVVRRNIKIFDPAFHLDWNSEAEFFRDSFWSYTPYISLQIAF